MKPEEIALRLCDKDLCGDNAEDVPAIAAALRTYGESEYQRGRAEALEVAIAHTEADNDWGHSQYFADRLRSLVAPDPEGES